MLYTRPGNMSYTFLAKAAHVFLELSSRLLQRLLLEIMDLPHRIQSIFRQQCIQTALCTRRCSTVTGATYYWGWTWGRSGCVDVSGPSISTRDYALFMTTIGTALDRSFLHLEGALRLWIRRQTLKPCPRLSISEAVMTLCSGWRNVTGPIQRQRRCL